MQGIAACTEEGELQLPKIGPELAAVVSVILKAGSKEKDEAQAAAKIIHQERVPRGVVLQLLTDAKMRGHPAYTHLSLEAATARAAKLPVDGVVEEIIALLDLDDNLEDVRRQKAATPARDQLPLEDMRLEFARMAKPNAVVAERSSGAPGDSKMRSKWQHCRRSPCKIQREREQMQCTLYWQPLARPI